MSSKRKLRSNGTTGDLSLDSTKNYKYNSSGTLIEATTIGGDDIVFSGSKSNLRRLADIERNVSILAAKALTEDGSSSGYGSSIDYASRAGKWATARTITLGGDLSGSVSIDGSANVTLSATVAGNTVALGTDTTGNYMVNVSAGTGISVSHTQGEGSTATISSTITQYTDALARGTVSAGTGISYNSSTGVITNTITQYTDALARGAVSFTAGSGAYNSTTGVFTIPTNTNQLTNGAGYVTSSGVTSIATSNGISGGTITSTGTLSLSGSYSGTWAVSGAITATGEVTAYFSDQRLKTNIVPIADALDKVESISGYTFDPNETALALGVDNRHQMGVIAQEIELVAPELVCDSAFEGYKTVRYDKLTALLIEAVKELSAKVKTLEAKLGDTKPQL